jgi:sigma-54 dependent transcriptional regulator, acetoin dehydrogenase operon transcriptional activator AcoR
VIGVDHLPDDFLDEFEGIGPAPTIATLAATAIETVAGAVVQGSDNLSGMIMSTSQNLESTTLSLIQRTLEMHQGNVSAAARQLGVSRNTLYRKLRQIWQL